MGILDSFVFLLQADADDAIRDVHRAGTEFDNLGREGQETKKILSTVFNGVAEKAGITTGSIKELVLEMTGIVGAGLSVNAVLERTTDLLARARDAETVGIDIEDYDALSQTFQSLGVDADGFRDSVIDLNESLGEAASDAESGKAKSFKEFGVSLRDAQGNIKTADQALLELSDSLSKMDKTKATFNIKQLGITDNAVISAMFRGRKELEEQLKVQKEIGVLRKDDVEKVKEFQTAQSQLTSIFGHFADQLAIGLVPVMKLVMDTILEVIKWTREYKGVMVGVLAAIGIAALAATPMLWGMAVAAWAAVAPFLPLIAAVAAFILVVDDLYNYFTGGDSVIGEWAKKFPWIGELLQGLKAEVLAAWEALKLLLTDPVKFAQILAEELQASWDAIIEGVDKAGQMMYDALAGAFDKMVANGKKVFTDLWDFIVNLFGQIGSFINDKIDSVVQGAKDLIPDWMKSEDKTVKGANVQPDIPNDVNPLVPGANAASAANDVIKGASTMPVISNANSRVSSVTNQQEVRVDKVEVHTQATDAQGIANGFHDGLRNAYANTAQSYDDGRSH